MSLQTEAQFKELSHSLPRKFEGIPAIGCAAPHLRLLNAPVWTLSPIGVGTGSKKCCGALYFSLF
jgi:hypothetical protein